MALGKQIMTSSDNKNLEWGIHIDINPIFPDIFLTFRWISKFPDLYKDLLTFPDFLVFSLFPDFFLTCGNPVKKKGNKKATQKSEGPHLNWYIISIKWYSKCINKCFNSTQKKKARHAAYIIVSWTDPCSVKCMNYTGGKHEFIGAYVRH